MGLTKPRAYQIFDIDYKQSVRVVATSNVTLSGGAPASVDGVSLSANDRVLVTGQSTASENGLYYVTVAGSGSDGTWARSVDGNETGEISAGLIVMVTEGSQYADTQWKLTTNDPITIGTTALTFVLNAVSVVGGLTTQVQYNDGGVLAGTANLTWSGSELYVNGTANVTGNVIGNYFIGNGSQLTGLPEQYGNANVVALLSDFGSNTIVTTGNVTGGNILTGGVISATGNITGGNLSATNIAGTLTTAAQTNITSVGTLSSLSVTSNITGGNISTAGQVVATGNITGGNISTAGDVTTATVTATGNITGGNLSVSTGTVTLGSIVNANADGVGNIGASGASFNTVFAKATSAQYADVAEFYRADADYPIGTVLEFGGNQEVTAAASNHTTAIAGTVSENPAVIMNSGLDHEYRTAVALLGRVPCRVVGSIQKGDRLAASHLPGVATALDPTQYQPGCIVGKALENYDSDAEGVIEIVVGRL